MTPVRQLRARHIAFLGLGAMGQRMAARLLAAGHRVTAWNRSPEPVRAMVALGAEAAPSPRAAAMDAELVISMVFDDAASRRVWLDAEDGAVLGLAPRALALECSTLSPVWVAELAATLPTPFVDAPVVGSLPQAEAGALIFLAGGEPEAVLRVTPVLQAMGSVVHAIGSNGAGAWLKLAVNSLFGTQVVAMAEQLALLRKAGVDLKHALDVIKTLPVSSPAAAGAGALMLAGHVAPNAPVDLIRKDLRYALQAAGQDMPLTAATAARFSDAQRAGLGAHHLTAVAELYGG